ncbi:MAG: hypothetical protein WA130_18885 [Candidatus Methanoperedens sp.]
MLLLDVRTVLLDIRTEIIIIGLFCDLMGGTLLAAEMIGLLEKIKNYNIKLQAEKDAISSELLKKESILAIIYIAAKFIKNGIIKSNDNDLKDIPWREALHLISMHLSIIKLKLSYSLSIVLINFTKKFGTERFFGILGVIFLWLGFGFQTIVNFLTK